MAKQNTGDRRERNKTAGQYPTQPADVATRDIFDRFFDERTRLDSLPRILGRFDRAFFPRMDITETDTEVKAVADMPGVDPENIGIDVWEDRMRITGKSEREYESEGSERPYQYERTYGAFRREITLPAHIKEDAVKAAYKDGVLTVVMPKVEEERRKKVAIEKK
jgi:HSP20 family protein